MKQIMSELMPQIREARLLMPTDWIYSSSDDFFRISSAIRITTTVTRIGVGIGQPGRKLPRYL